jgi:translocation and assembly module TamB
MTRPLRWIAGILGGLSTLLLLGLLWLLLAANTPYGRTAIARAVVIFSGGSVEVSELDGDFWGQVSIGRIDLQDAAGTWLTVDALQLDWRPGRLLTGELALDRLQARNIKLERMPVSAAVSKAAAKLSLPLAIDLRSLVVDHLELAPALAGDAADFSISGKLALSAINRGQIELQINRLRKQGAYRLQALLTDDGLQAQLSLQEAAAGPLATLAGLNNQEELNLNASLSGPWAAVHSHLELKLDDLQTLVDGDIDWLQTSVDLTLTAKSAAMKLRPELAWRTLALNLRLRGPLTGLNVNGGLQLDKLKVGSTGIDRLAINMQGENGQLRLDGELAGLGLAVAEPDLLGAEPLVFQATVDVAKPDFPSTLALQHSLIAASAQAVMPGGHVNADLAVTLPNLHPVAALVGLQMAGSGQLVLKFVRQDANNQLDLNGQLNLGRGDNVWAKVLGEAAKFDLGITLQGDDVTVSGLHLQGKAVSLAAVGGLIAGQADFNWQAQLDTLAAIIPGDAGRLTTQGRLSGRQDDFSVSSALNAELASQGNPNGSIAANLQLQHLPHRAEGGLKLGGVLWRAPLDVQLTVNSPGPDSLRIAIDQANWKSAQARGSLLFTPGGAVPTGKIDLQIERLADLQALLKQPVSGSVKASLEAVMQNNRPQARIMLVADNVGVAGSVAIEHSRLELGILDPAGRPMLNGLLDLNGVNAGKLAGTAHIKLDGALDALSLGLSGDLPDLSGSAAQFSATALLNTGNSSMLINALQANWRQQTVRLLSPAKIAYSDGLSVDRLRLGLQQAELELAGRITPDLALTAELHQTSAELLSLFAPIPAISGTLHADANLHGSLSQPTGLLHVDADGLQFKNNQGLPPARLTASAVLHGESADVDAALKADANLDLRIAGQAPLNRSGLLAMHGDAALDLKLLDPLLNASGRRLRGQLAANAQLTGNWSSPLLSGTAQISHGEWQDFTSGVGMSDFNAALAVEEGRLRIVNMDARAGPGTLSVTGGIDLLTVGMPVDLTITARKARPLASDQLTVNLDADVVLGGLALESMTASGRIHLNRVDMQIPERLPVGIVVLKLSGGPAANIAATPEQSRNIALNLIIDAPREIFIRGRGMDAELGGTVRVTGDLNHPHPDGDFKLRNGQYMLAGQVLVFNQGAVGFDNNSLTNPSLNFVAISTRNNITATVTVTGSVRQMKIALSSIPVLPQDEVLANLLFGKGAASLSALQMVQISAALASLTGVTSGIGDPLESARKLLGLDRLSAGGVNPALDAGRYIAPGVYLGAKQGFSGGAPQPVIQIDLTTHLKLEGGVGSGAAASSTAGSAATSSVGVIYQIDY